MHTVNLTSALHLLSLCLTKKTASAKVGAAKKNTTYGGKTVSGIFRGATDFIQSMEDG
jgi:hypothetical protein